jgi:hypothetical protein
MIDSYIPYMFISSIDIKFVSDLPNVILFPRYLILQYRGQICRI